MGTRHPPRHERMPRPREQAQSPRQRHRPGPGVRNPRCHAGGGITMTNTAGRPWNTLISGSIFSGHTVFPFPVKGASIALSEKGGRHSSTLSLGAACNRCQQPTSFPLFPRRAGVAATAPVPPALRSVPSVQRPVPFIAGWPGRDAARAAVIVKSPDARGRNGFGVSEDAERLNPNTAASSHDGKESIGSRHPMCVAIFGSRARRVNLCSR